MRKVKKQFILLQGSPMPMATQFESVSVTQSVQIRDQIKSREGRLPASVADQIWR